MKIILFSSYHFASISIFCYSSKNWNTLTRWILRFLVMVLVDKFGKYNSKRHENMVILYVLFFYHHFVFSFAHDSVFFKLLAETCCFNTCVLISCWCEMWIGTEAVKLKHLSLACCTMRHSTIKMFTRRWKFRIYRLCNRNYHNTETKVCSSTFILTFLRCGVVNFLKRGFDYDVELIVT